MGGKPLESLVNYGLLSFGREKAVYDLLKHVVEASLDEKPGESIITVRKGGKKAVIKTDLKKVKLSGDVKSFSKEFEVLEKDCLNEYANSVRSKKELLMNLSTGKFYKFVLVPVLLDAYNYHNLNLKEFVEVLNNTPAEQNFLFFKMKKKIKAVLKGKSLSVVFENAEFNLKLEKKRIQGDLILKNLDVSEYQNTNMDAFFAGLPYTLASLKGEDFEYSFNGPNDGLKIICQVVLESLYKYLMIENV